MSGFALKYERENMTKTNIPKFNVGDTVDIGVRIKEGDKERVQVFNGVVIARKGTGLRESFTVRRIVEGEGVERIFPLHSPNVVSIDVKRAGRVRRAKLYYLRKRVGKATRVKELLNAEHVGKLDGNRNLTGGKGESKPEPQAEGKPKAESKAAKPEAAAAKA